jgi:hypothetical protein
MKRTLIVLMTGFLVLGCGSDDCDDAIDKLSECNLGADYANVNFDDEDCDGRTQCIADCINGSSCAEITAAEATSTYRTCIAACG